LIGRTTIEHDTITQEYHELDENLLTGDTIEKTVTEKGREKNTKERRAKKPLIRLSDHAVFN
jgi:predicted metal-dependent hydrolase